MVLVTVTLIIVAAVVIGVFLYALAVRFERDARVLLDADRLFAELERARREAHDDEMLS